MQINQIIAAKLAGVITPEEDKLLNEWLSSEESHREQYEQIVARHDFKNQMDAYEQIDVRTGWKRLETRITQDEKSQKRNSTRIISLRPSLLKYAAVLLLIIAAGALLWYNKYTEVTPPDIPAEVRLAMTQSEESGKAQAKIEDLSAQSTIPTYNKANDISDDSNIFTEEKSYSDDVADLIAARRITTMHDKEFWLTLDDGTLVHLNNNTRLIYPEKFGRGKRNVILDGEAFFMVAKDKSRPFIVHTPNGDVKVYGTEFNVNTRNESMGTSGTTVVLVKGSVGVTPNNGREQMLLPGQQATLRTNSLTASIEDVDVEPYIAWNTGKFSFHNWQLERIMDVLSHWYGYTVEYKDPSIRQLTFSGNFDRYEKIRPTMDFISEVSGLKIEIKQNKIIIEK